MPEGCALVTGGSRGIGAAVARQLAAYEWPVAVGYRRDQDGARATVAAIREAGGTALAVQGDVAEPDDGERMLATARAELGEVLVLVNNAGARADGLAMGMRDEEWSCVLETNLTGAFRLTRAALRTMVRSRYGRVVNIASIVGPKGNPGQANYAASKAGLIALTRSVAAEVAKRGVTVNAVAPGLVQTDMTKGLDPSWTEMIPAKRAGTPDEIAACVRFLVSDDASYVNGAVLTVDGGLTA